MDDMGLDNARDYYGKVLSGSQDLRTDACATTDAADGNPVSAAALRRQLADRGSVQRSLGHDRRRARHRHRVR